MNYCQKTLSAGLLGIAALAVGASPAWAQTAPDLGTASNFVVLGGTGVTCTDSTITGAVGSLVSVLPTATCTITGPIHAADDVAIAAHEDFLLAYNSLAGITCDAAHTLSGDLGGMILSPGVYCISGVGLLTSQLTLRGRSTGIWIFKAESSITPIGGSVVMENGGLACNVYWQTGSEVSLDATDFLGNILAGSAITFTGVGSSLVGRALAKTAVTTTGTTISGCGGTQPPSCDRDHKRHKHCKHHKNDKPHCDGDHDGHGNGHHGHHKGHGNGHDGHDDDNGHGNGHGGDDDDNGHGNGHDGDDDDNGRGSDHRSPWSKK